MVFTVLIKGELSDGGPVVTDDAAARELPWLTKSQQMGACSLSSIHCCSRSRRTDPHQVMTAGCQWCRSVPGGYISGLYQYGSRRCARRSQLIAAERVDQLSRRIQWFMDDELRDSIGHQVLFATFTIGHCLANEQASLMDAWGIPTTSR